MAAICINDLQAGFDLISDHETYLNELTDEEFRITKGGASTPLCIVSIVSLGLAVSTLAVGGAAAAGYYAGKAYNRYVK